MVERHAETATGSVPATTVAIGNSAQSFLMTLADVEISYPAVSRPIRLPFVGGSAR